MYPGSSPGSALGCTASIIKPSRAVFAVLVRFMLVCGTGEAHFLASGQKQSINCNRF